MALIFSRFLLFEPKLLQAAQLGMQFLTVHIASGESGDAPPCGTRYWKL